MSRHTITRSEMNQITVSEVIASSAGGGNITKRLLFVYDIGRKRMGFELQYQNDGQRVQWFDDMGEAIEAYNEI